jgi:hypothetical protein
MLDPSMPYGRATPETALQLSGGWPARRAGGLQTSSTILDTPCRTPMPIGLTRIGLMLTPPPPDGLSCPGLMTVQNMKYGEELEKKLLNQKSGRQ